MEGDRLTLYPDGPVYSVSWNGEDHMALKVDEKGSEAYTRLGTQKDPRNKLVGEWTGNRDMDGKKVLAHWIFDGNSTAVLMIRFLTQSGRFTVRSGRLIATFAGQVGLDGLISFVDNILTIDRSRGRVTKLSRY